jgi:hypothetical protein
MYRVHTYYFLALTFFVVLLSGCKGSLDLDGNEGIPIEFALPNFDVQVKGVQLTTDNISNFGVFASLENNGRSFSDNSADLSTFMSNVEVQKDKETGKWCATPAHYWPIFPVKKLSFFAYAPYGVVGNDAAPDWGSRTITLPYAVAANPASQSDFCVARAVLDKTKEDAGNPISFEFVHTLSFVTFVANYVGTVPDGCYLRVDELTLSNLYNSSSLTLNSNQQDDQPFFEWGVPEESKNASYTLSVGNNTLDDKELCDISKGTSEFVMPDGLLYLVPQEVNADDNSARSILDVTFSFVKKDSRKSIVAQFYTSLQLPNGVWQAGRKHKYQFTIDVSKASLIDISLVDGGWIEDWENSKEVVSGKPLI